MAEGFVSPTTLATLDARTGQILVGDQVGVIRVMEKDGALRPEPFLDLTSRLTKLNSGFDERGLLGLALHPKFNQNRRFYVYYSAPKRLSTPEGWDHTSRLSEFQVRKENRLSVDLASEKVILEIDKPYFNHNGGCIAFGPDHFLYIPTGDGGNGNGKGIGHSPISNGQDLNTLLGKMLRIDVDHGNPYAIPSDNPYAKGGGKPEIFAYGLRNPWRMSFDRGGQHDLFVGDIGQTLYEEINRVVKGGNYGWFIKEGSICFNPDNEKIARTNCVDKGGDGKPLIGPILSYKNPNGFRNDKEAIGISVMGGFVYRGKAMPKLQGHYVFGDWSKNWGLPQGAFMLGRHSGSVGNESWALEMLIPVMEDGGQWKGYITGFGEDASGELYVLVNSSNGLVGKTGKVFKLIAAE
ncbi:MAG: PQQ-dependent sugar dehydrogenase [Verrucomicrobia bacterium]|nr:PQQ-dependent sugar dehydrogenase [Verrucomicrobiota bacterium]MBI3869590.1 PQQ-dependent sugar dehydrogenase [Verrucomicrobiota bacterium]